LQAVYDKRCASCHGQDTGRIRPLNFGQVEKSPAFLAPSARAAGGKEVCGQPAFLDRPDPDAQALLEVLHKLPEEVKTNPREDMLAARPPWLDENCRDVYRP